MTRAFHGTGEQAIQWLVEEYRDFEHEVFLRMWHQGDAEAEWPEFYEWLDRQPVAVLSEDHIETLIGVAKDDLIDSGKMQSCDFRASHILFGAACIKASLA